MSKIFINYRRDDSGWAGRLWDKLAPYFGSDNLFMDIDTIEPGNVYDGLGSLCAGDTVR